MALLARVAARYRSFGRSKQIDLARRALFIVVCLVASVLYGLSIVRAEQAQIAATTMKDQQQDDHMSATDTQVLELRQALKDLDQDRSERRKEAFEWRKEMSDTVEESRDRQNRDEGFAGGAFVVLGVLQGLGFVKKFKTADKAENPEE